MKNHQQPALSSVDSSKPETSFKRPTFGEAFRFWLKLGFISFGGPAGQIAIMHTELVEKKKWIEDSRFLHALNFCMLLPGPGGPATGNLHRVALAPDLGRNHCGNVICVTQRRCTLGTRIYLYGLWGRRLGCIGLRRIKTSSACSCGGGGSTNRGKGPEKCGVSPLLAFIAIFFFKSPLSSNYRDCRTDRVDGQPNTPRPFCNVQRAW